MDETFKVGDIVMLLFFEIAGTVVEISTFNQKDMLFVSKDLDDVVCYRVQIAPDAFITTDGSGLKLVVPERVSE